MLLKVVPNALQDRDHQLAWERRHLIERYLTLQAEIHVHFGLGISRGRLVSGDYCAAFHFLPLPEHLDVAHLDVLASEPDLRSSELDQMDAAMLVDVVEFMELPEGVRPIVLPSQMRLQSLDDCLSDWRDAPNPILRFVAHGSAPEDRELRGVFVTGRERVRVSECKFERHVVHGTSKVVDDVPDEAPEEAVIQLDPHDVAGSIRIAFIDQEVSIRFVPPLGPFEGVDVMARPVKLEAVAAMTGHPTSMPYRLRIHRAHRSSDQGSNIPAISSQDQT